MSEARKAYRFAKSPRLCPPPLRSRCDRKRAANFVPAKCDISPAIPPKSARLVTNHRSSWKRGLSATSIGSVPNPISAIPATATILDACEFFVLYKFFAFPVVDEQRRVVGVIDVSLFAEEILGEREEQPRPATPVRDDVFEVLGFHLEQIRGASPWRVFRFRFPWLLVTVAAGTICAVLAGAFEATLARSLVVAFFLTMVLGLNESVSAQSMSVNIQMLRSAPVTWGWFATALRRELMTAILLGLSCGSVVAAIVWFWRSDLRSAGAIGGSIALSLVTACLFGLGVPSLLHRLKLDPKIAAGPITLALADICALLLYFTAGPFVLRLPP